MICSSVHSQPRAVLVALGAGSAGAAPDVSGSTTLVEPNGLYTAIKTFEVYSPTNGTNPLPLAGNFTYIYTITNTAGSFTCLVGFDLEVPAGSVTAAGFIPGAGVAPSGTTVGASVVQWDWFSPTLCPGQTSEQLFVHSTYGPGTVERQPRLRRGRVRVRHPGHLRRTLRSARGGRRAASPARSASGRTARTASRGRSSGSRTATSTRW